MKDTRCSREEAAAFLEKDLKRAFRKGYTTKELCALLKKAGIIIPERLVARYQEPGAEARENGYLKSEKQGNRDERKSLAPHPKTEDATLAENTTTTSKNEGAPRTKPESGGQDYCPLTGGRTRGERFSAVPAPSSGPRCGCAEKGKIPYSEITHGVSDKKGASFPPLLPKTPCASRLPEV
ncbi:MAG: hypothetical protein HDQ92_02400 [Desulfovibrio sp.]|nr:hypothetical protein [Desulfovibrio sp.]